MAISKIERILYAESDSYIVYGRGFSGEVPESMIKLIRDQRIKRIEDYQNSESEWYQKEEIFDIATDSEAMLYLSGASQAFPLSHTWGKLYMLLFTKHYSEQMSKEMGVYTTKEEIDDYKLEYLLKLKKWIRV